MSNNPQDQPNLDPNDSGFAPDPNEQPESQPPAEESAAPERGAANLSPKERMRQAVESRRGDDEDEREEELWQGGYCSKAMFGYWIIAGLVTVGLLVAVFLINWRNPWFWLGWLCISLGLWAWFGILYLYRHWTVKYELTTQRFIHESGLLKRLIDRIEVIDIDDVAFVQGPVERMVGVGSITITSSDRSHPELTLRGIENVRSVAGLLDDVRRKERRRRGLHIEAI